MSAAMIGRYMIVKHPDLSTNGYLIGDIQREGGKTLVVLAEHDPGFEFYPDGSSQQNFHPGKRWFETHMFTIANVEKQSF